MIKIALVGAEIEENLALRYLSAAVRSHGHEPLIFDFRSPAQIPDLADRITCFGPDLVGLSMVFTARAREFIQLATTLREKGFRGHTTAGGHFASFHARELLRDCPAIDSTIHGEGEETLAELADRALDPTGILGMTWRDKNGNVRETGRRRLPDDLDDMAWPTRPEKLPSYLGSLPLANMLSGRGCYGNCHFCSINAWYRENPGKRFRQRSPERIAEEMATLYHDRDVRIFNFHDDNFFLPDHRANSNRFHQLKSALNRLGVGRIAIQIKARPDSIVPEALDPLIELGLFRVFLGVESNAVAGLKALGRGILRERNQEALKLLLDYDLHVTFNLLMFEPDATLSDLRDNSDFIRRNAEVPLNFGRVEIYSGTALERQLRSTGRLEGDYLGYTYRLSDPAASLAYRLFREVFLPRNFHSGAMNLESMGLDYEFHLLKHFYPRRATPDLGWQVREGIASLNRNSADLLEDIFRFAGSDQHHLEENVQRRLHAWGEERSEFDRRLRKRFSEIQNEIRDRASNRWPRSSKLRWATSTVASAILFTSVACDPPGHYTEMAPTPLEEQRRFSPEETNRIEKRISQTYQESLAKAGLFVHQDTDVRLWLGIDSKGRVFQVHIHSATPPASDDFQKLLTSEAFKWTFTDTQGGGACVINIHIKPERTHMFEFMERPKPENKD